ncbi:MAG TPA: hypothetical protein VN255_00075, partial [Mycobacterium sp.]|nr:hypothetical protein [Mycobacterium sp.]
GGRRTHSHRTAATVSARRHILGVSTLFLCRGQTTAGAMMHSKRFRIRRAPQALHPAPDVLVAPAL